jgi:hypothetical protein
MSRPKAKGSPAALDKMLGEASWLLSHAQALGDYGRREAARAELARAARCEEQVACLLDAAGQELEAAIHHVSAASCHEKLAQYVQAVTLLRAALAGPLDGDYHSQVERLLRACLNKARKELDGVARARSRKRPSGTP